MNKKAADRGLPHVRLTKGLGKSHETRGDTPVKKKRGRKQYQLMHNSIRLWRWTSILGLIGQFYFKKHISVSALEHVIH